MAPEIHSLIAATVAAEQCRRLSEHGVRQFHFYTMNKPELSMAVCRTLGLRPAGSLRTGSGGQLIEPVVMGESTDPTPDIGLEEAYAVKTPTGNKELYEDWAPTYESGFIEYMGYVYHRTVADLFAAHRGGAIGQVLDVGCGTGIVGVELRRLGIEPVDGLDISPAMLAEAATKTDSGGEAA